IQGAVLPLAEKYHHVFPFKGAILAGVFTAGAISQMRSLGFTILHFTYEMVVETFAKFGIDAAFDEGTPDKEFKRKVDAYEALTPTRKQALARSLLESNEPALNNFIGALKHNVSRTVDSIVVLPLHGLAKEYRSVDEAITFITKY